MDETADPGQTLREARQQYFEANGFGRDGGYDARWVRVKLGPIPFVFPNTSARKRAVRFHDLHHVLTDYRTDLLGEAEIGAWELASGCADHYAAWYLNMAAMGIGLLLDPGALSRAFKRGRHTGNLYRSSFSEELLRRRVADVRAELRLDTPAPTPTAGDAIALAAFAAASLAALGAALPFTPLALLARGRSKRPPSLPP
jgi:hypothetical protein